MTFSFSYLMASQWTLQQAQLVLGVQLGTIRETLLRNRHHIRRQNVALGIMYYRIVWDACVCLLLNEMGSEVVSSDKQV